MSCVCLCIYISQWFMSTYCIYDVLILISIDCCIANHTRDTAREIVSHSVFPEMFAVLKAVPNKVDDINRYTFYKVVQI